MNLSLPNRSKGRPRISPPQIRTTVITSDHHIPQMDTAAYRSVLYFIGDIRPDYHFLAGDILDCHDQSTFIKDPELSNRTEESLDLANQMLDELATVSPNTITKVLWGNHEKRLTKRLFENPDILPFVAKGKKPDQLLAESLSLDERGIDWVSYPSVYNHWGFYIAHGEYANIHAAKKELETHGVSGCSGHIHKNKTWERHDRNGTRAWYSLGGLCSHEVSYRPNNDWVNGFGVLKQIVGSDLFTFQAIPIIKGQFIYGTKLYNQDGAFEST